MTNGVLTNVLSDPRTEKVELMRKLCLVTVGLFLLTLGAAPIATRADDPAEKATEKAAEKPAAKSAEKPAEQEEAIELKTDRDRVSYGIGTNVGGQLKSQPLDLDLEMLIRGLRDAFAGKESPLTPDEFREALTNLQKESQANAEKAAKDFLTTNAKAEGVKSTKSGLQYQVLKLGEGKRPTAKDSVKAHYKGTFLNGKSFDSSYDRGEPSVFPLDGVIKGWTEGVQLMPIGSKYRFWIPSDLAYGPQGRPGIPPNSLLVFEIELIDIVPADEDEK